MTYWDTGSAYLGIDDGTNTTDTLRFWSDGAPYYFVFTTTAGGSSIKTVEGLALASVKTIDGLAIASVKTLEGLSNV